MTADRRKKRGPSSRVGPRPLVLIIGAIRALLLGVVASILISVVCSARSHAFVSDMYGLGAEDARAQWEARTGNAPPGAQVVGEVKRAFGWEYVVLQSGDDLDAPLSADNPLAGSVHMYRSGWPFYCFSSRWITLGRDQEQRGHRFRLRQLWPTWSSNILPSYPIWHGLVLNAALYGSMLWGAVFGWRCVKPIWRYQRGFCPKCGYNLREEGRRRARYLLDRGCPECGWNREGETAQAESESSG